MPDLILYLHVPTEIALESGQSVAGDFELVLTTAQVAQIRDEGWIELAAPYIDTTRMVRAPSGRLEVNFAVPGSLPYTADAAFTWPAVVHALKAKVDERNRAAERAAKKHASGLSVVRRLGHRDQLARFEAGVLPDDELLAMVRELAFTPFAELPRYHNRFLTPASITHRFGCRRHDRPDPSHPDQSLNMQSSAAPKLQLTSKEWESTHALRELAKTVPEEWARAVNEPGFSVPLVAPLEHKLTCPACLASAQVTSFKITALWHGHELTREYMP